MAVSEAQKRAYYKYAHEKLKRIPLCIRKDDYLIWKEAADRAGESMNGYIKEAVSMRMRSETP